MRKNKERNLKGEPLFCQIENTHTHTHTHTHKQPKSSLLIIDGGQEIKYEQGKAWPKTR